MKRFSLQILIIFFCGILSAQHQEYFIDADSSSANYSDIILDKSEHKPSFDLDVEDRLNVNMQVGSSFSNFHGGNFFNSYAAPSVSFDATNKLRLSVGTMASFTNFNGSLYSGEGSQSDYGQRMTRYYMFARGEYLISENINLRASTIFSPSTVGFGNETNSYMHNIGFDVKIGENASFHADFNFIKSSNPYEFYTPGFGRNDMFNRRHSYGFPTAF